MSTNDLCWMIGGPQGTGVDSSATLFARACAVAGYWVYGRREYHSNIKGEHSYFQVRARTEPVSSHIDPVHLLATFENSTAILHAFEVVDDGAFIYDPKLTKPEDLPLKPGVLKFPLDFDGILEQMAEESGKSVTALSIMKNTIAVGASMAVLGMDLTVIQQALEGLFTGSKSKLIPLNLKAATLAYEQVKQHPDVGKYNHTLVPPTNVPAPGSRILMNGAQSAALGKLLAGSRFLTYYSITPAVDECIFLEDLSEYGMMVVQCEDEMAAVNAATGAASTGTRSSTSTSGPGFCLMAEGIGWAGINELPTVVYLYQRGGPSTGLPTRTEQGDLLFAIHAGHGEFPRLVITPGDVTEQFYDSFNAFNYADRYQTPVILLTDKAIANNNETVPIFDQTGLKIDRGSVVGPPIEWTEGLNTPENIEVGIRSFERFKMNPDNPVSPRAYPGTPGRIFWQTGDEHTELGHITEEPEIRLPMHEKRMKKLDLALAEIPQDLQYKLHGPESAPITLVSWGSTKGPILNAMPVLKEQHGVEVNFLQIRLMHPFPSEAVSRILNKAQTVLSVENTYGNQIGQLIRMRTGFEIKHEAVKWTGRPISQTELIQAVLDVHQNQSRKVVLTYGV